MKTRAAVAFEAKKPLEIIELDLDGPKAGEVLVEIKAYLYLFKERLRPGRDSSIVILPSWFYTRLYPSLRIDVLLIPISGSVKRFVV